MSSSRPKVNLRSTAVKRIMQEASELANANIDEDGFVAAPLEDDIFEWHCTMRGVSGSEYDGGLYHLRILLPPSYPMSAPDIMLMTPNGRFELGKKICIDGLTSFHAGSWQPAWGVRTAVLGLRSFWMQNGEALSAIGALDYSKEERKRLSKLSKDWKCSQCGLKNCEIIPSISSSSSTDLPKKENICSNSDSNVQDQGVDEKRDHSIVSDDKGQGQKEENSNSTADNPESEVSINPNPQEIPTIFSPSTLATATSVNSTNSIQALPINIIPPSLENPPSPLPINEDTQSPSSPPLTQSGPLTYDTTDIPPNTPVSNSSTIRSRTNSAQTVTTTNANTAVLPRPTPTTTSPSPQRSPRLYLIDSAIFVLLFILTCLIARRMA